MMRQSHRNPALGLLGVVLAAPIAFFGVIRRLDEDTEGIPLLILGTCLLGLSLLLGRRLRASPHRAVWLLLGVALALAAVLLGFGLVSVESHATR